MNRTQRNRLSRAKLGNREARARARWVMLPYELSGADLKHYLGVKG